MQALASSLNRADLEQFAKTQNDEFQANLVEIVEFPLVDDYGYFIQPHEFPDLRPLSFDALSSANWQDDS